MTYMRRSLFVWGPSRPWSGTTASLLVEIRKKFLAYLSYLLKSVMPPICSRNTQQEPKSGCCIDTDALMIILTERKPGQVHNCSTLGLRAVIQHCKAPVVQPTRFRKATCYGHVQCNFRLEKNSSGQAQAVAAQLAAQMQQEALSSKLLHCNMVL